MEFRIFYLIFCSTFQIQKGAFAFDEYVAKVFQRYVQELIEIRMVDWFYVTVVLCLNLGRVKLNLQWNSCELHDIECHEKRDVWLFSAVGMCLTTLPRFRYTDIFLLLFALTAGIFVFAFGLILLAASRRIELTILAQHGLKSHLHYAKFMQV